MVSKILKDHIVGGKIFKKAAAKDDYYEQIKKQTRVALQFGGSIDPENIDEYIEDTNLFLSSIGNFIKEQGEH